MQSITVSVDPSEYCWALATQVAPPGSQAWRCSDRKAQASEPLTLHEPRDSRFCEEQHPTINVMQQVMQRETADAQDRVQSVET